MCKKAEAGIMRYFRDRHLKGKAVPWCAHCLVGNQTAKNCKMLALLCEKGLAGSNGTYFSPLGKEINDHMLKGEIFQSEIKILALEAKFDKDASPEEEKD